MLLAQTHTSIYLLTKMFHFCVCQKGGGGYGGGGGGYGGGGGGYGGGGGGYGGSSGGGVCLILNFFFLKLNN